MSRITIRNFILSLILLLVVFGIVGYLYLMIGTKEKQLAEQLVAIKTQNDREQTSFRLEKIAKESAIEREEIKKYFLPQAGESITFLTQVESLAPENGVVLKTDSLEEGGNKETNEKWVTATFTFSGTRSSVERFITILENLPYLSQINSVQLIGKDGGGWEAKVTMQVAVLHYEI